MSKNNDGSTDKPIKYLMIKKYLSEKYDFRFNKVSLDVEFKLKKQAEWKTLEEGYLEDELYTLGYTGFDKQLSSLLKSPFVEKYDPILTYFESLPVHEPGFDWIGKLASYVKTTDQEFFVRQFRKMLVRMIAQALHKIPFNKHCFTLYSKQHDGKTYFLDHLVENTILKKYSMKNIDFEGKDSKIALATNFLINLDELAGLSKQDVNRAKAYFSESQIKLRIPFEKHPVIINRIGNFVGSTNTREFLVDETGSVRWIVSEVLSIIHDNGGPNGYCSVDINKVWAHAYYLFKEGFNPNLSKDEIEHSEKNNTLYNRETSEYQLLQKYFIPMSKDKGGTHYQPVDLVAFFQKVLGTSVRLSNEGVGRALAKLGVEKSQASRGVYSVWGYWLKENVLNQDGLTPPSDTPF